MMNVLHHANKYKFKVESIMSEKKKKVILISSVSLIFIFIIAFIYVCYYIAALWAKDAIDRFNSTRFPVYMYSNAIFDYKEANYLEFDVTGTVDDFFPRYSEIEDYARVADFQFSDYYTNFPEDRSDEGHQWGILVIVLEEENYLDIKEKTLELNILDSFTKYDFVCYQIDTGVKDVYLEICFCDKVNAVRYYFTYQIDPKSKHLSRFSGYRNEFTVDPWTADSVLIDLDTPEENYTRSFESCKKRLNELNDRMK